MTYVALQKVLDFDVFIPKMRIAAAHKTPDKFDPTIS
jgi:hypothetical protein